MGKLLKLFFLVGLVLILPNCTVHNTDSTTVIPEPVSMHQTSGKIQLDNNATISVSTVNISHLADYLAKRLHELNGIEVARSESNATIKLNVNLELPDSLGSEGYILISTKKEISIEAREEAGLFYGVQTLLQLIKADGIFPLVEIIDHPRFAWRGFMLDVSRHFMPKEYILKVLDNLALHKMNSFHLHLVDDQGWRIEIKQYP